MYFSVINVHSDEIESLAPLTQDLQTTREELGEEGK